MKTHYRACHLCEAICGLTIEVDNDKIVSIKGDKQDPLSRGHICPKAIALKDLQEDQDRLKYPVKKTTNGWQQIEWNEAFELIADKLCSLQKHHGNDAIAFYAGNPGAHNYGNQTHGRLLRHAVQTKNNFSATSLDQLPHQLIALAMYGHQFLLPIPDIDHTDFMLILGANPLVSNGSMMTVPDVTKRLKSIQKRGGKIVVIDPRRSETANIASQHLFIKPGSDAYLLFAMLNELFEADLVNIEHTQNHLEGLEIIQQVVKPFTPELAEQMTAISAEQIRQLTKEFATTKKAVIYGRMGVSVQQFGSLCQWAIQLLNILTNHVDVRGGAIPASPAFGYISVDNQPGRGHFARFHSRVSGLPEFGGELPVSVLAEEILTPGKGQIKGLITIAGNPVISAPNGTLMDKALEQLDFMVAIDLYINASTRHADIILPPTGPLEHDHYDIVFHRLSVHNTARFNEALFAPESGTKHDWQIFNELSAVIAERKGLDFKAMPAPHVIVDMGIRNGPHGESANLEQLKANPHGVDLGVLQPSLLDRLCTADATIQLAPDFLVDDLQRLQQNKAGGKAVLKLIGRRHVRSNNSWMHNYQRLVKGKPRWQLIMHPDDMAQRNIENNQLVIIRSRVGSVQTIAIASDEVMQGVVSLPHGWGHHTNGRDKGARMAIALKQQGVSANDLCDDKFYDTLTGNAVLNGVDVEVEAV